MISSDYTHIDSDGRHKHEYCQGMEELPPQVERDVRPLVFPDIAHADVLEGCLVDRSTVATVCRGSCVLALGQPYPPCAHQTGLPASDRSHDDSEPVDGQRDAAPSSPASELAVHAFHAVTAKDGEASAPDPCSCETIAQLPACPSTEGQANHQQEA